MATAAKAPVRTRNGAQQLETEFDSLQTVERRMLEDLKASQLTAKDAAKLQMQPYTAQQVQRLFPTLPVARAGYSIPYFTTKGRATKFYRFRYLEYGDTRGFAAVVASTSKKLRYAQPTETINEVYLPPFIDWSTYATDTAKPLLFTEGEKKSACSTRNGLPCVGLGGVWSWRSAKQHMPMLPAFDEFDFKDRKCFICYDSDAASNTKVVQAENALARHLLQRGAVPYIVRLPGLAEQDKTGLDDYIVAEGTEKLTYALMNSTAPVQSPRHPMVLEFRPAQELCALNEEVVYVVDPGVVLRVENMQRMTARAFADHAYAPRIYYEEQETANGTKFVEKSAAREWIRWPMRNSVPRITYAPGEGRITKEGEYNCWQGWGCEPVKGSVDPWHRLLDYLFQGAEPEGRAWFEQWLAYPLQHPGTKLYSACVMWGRVHGTGKSLVGYSMFKLYGDGKQGTPRNATEISDRELHNAYNEWAENKQFVMGEEITGGDKRNTADRMKSMITQQLLRLNPKYVPSYTVPDCINYYFTSNHPDAFFLEDTDRRFFIHEVQESPMPPTFYREYAAWLHGSGASALFHYMLNLDTRKFDPKGHAFGTQAKQEMISDGRSELASWVARLLEQPEAVLQVAGKPLPYTLFTTRELMTMFDPSATSKVTQNGLARELKRGGLRRLANGNGVRTTEGQLRLWAVRDAAAMRDRNATWLGQQYDKERGRKPVGNGDEHKNGNRFGGRKKKF